MDRPEGYIKAIELLTRAATPEGFVASPVEKDNYRRIWTRDGVVMGIAAVASGEASLIECFRRTLETVFSRQHVLGFMPSNVMTTGSASYGGTVGRADNPSWAVAGLCLYTLNTGDAAFAKAYTDHVAKCLHVLDVWEYNGKHLVYVPQSGDWADEYFYHGYVLTDQLLRVWALRLAAQVYQRSEWSHKADQISATIRRNFWNRTSDVALYAKNLEHQLATAPTQYWFMGFNPARIYSRFDLLANSLALLSGLGDAEQDRIVADYITGLIRSYGSIAPCFYPAAEEEDDDMADLANNYAYHFRNYPHQFHNGGLWPVWNGFAAAALVRCGRKTAARELTDLLHAANASDNWNFNECLHGQTKEPIGVPWCSWSAAGAVIAENALSKEETLTHLMF